MLSLPEVPAIASALEEAWPVARRACATAREELATAGEGIALQNAYDGLLAAERRCTQLIHAWFAQALGLDRVVDPHILFSLDVDGVLEGENEGYSSAQLAGIAGLRLLQLGGIAVVLNTARNLPAVRDRVSQFRLLGGVAEFGAGIYDAVFRREHIRVSDRGAEQLHRLRADLTTTPSIVLDQAHRVSVRASRIANGTPGPITGPDARELLDRQQLSQLEFWVAPHYTDFVDRTVDKGTGLGILQASLALGPLPLAAMGDGACDVPMLRRAQRAFLPAATLPAYRAARRQTLVRARHLGGQAVWEAASRLVPSSALHKRVVNEVRSLTPPAWFPRTLLEPLPSAGFLPRMAPAFLTARRYHPTTTTSRRD